MGEIQKKSQEAICSPDQGDLYQVEIVEGFPQMHVSPGKAELPLEALARYAETNIWSWTTGTYLSIYLTSLMIFRSSEM